MIEQIITSSVLIVAVLLLSALFERRMNPCIRYTLWLLVVVKLLVPVPEFESPISVMNVVGQLQELEVPLQVMSEEITDVKESAQINWLSAIQILWVVGMVLCALVFVGSNVRFSQDLKKNRVLVGRFQHKLSVYQVQGIVSPCLFGLFKPAIYLQDNCELTEEQRLHVCAHEYMHYRHGDHVWTVIRCICVIVYWFNPLVWIAAKVSMKDSEEACDAGTWKLIGEQNNLAYGQTLVHIAKNGVQRQSVMRVLDCSTGAVGGRKEMKRRIQMIVKQPGTKRMSIMILMMVCISLVGCTFGSEVENVEPSGQAESELEAFISEAVGSETSAQDKEAMQAALEEVYNKLAVEQAEIEKQNATLLEEKKKETAALKEQEALKAAYAAVEAEQAEVERQIAALQDTKEREAAALKEE